MAAQTGNNDIARRYALALFDLAKEQGLIDRIAGDLESFRHMLAESGDLQKFINNATLQRTAQAKALRELGKKAEFSALMLDFFGTLAMKRRLEVLPEIIAALQGEIARHKGEVTAEVTAATKLDSAQLNSIAAQLKKSLGMTVKVELKQDASIMGGLIIRVGSQLIDSSVRSKLERLHRSLKSSNTSSDKTKMREVA